MEKLQITKGEWKPQSRTYKISPKEIITGIKIDFAENYSMRVLDTILPDSDAEYIEAHNEIKSNVLLACDAANTYNECKTLPSELLRQNREMKEALEMITEMNYQTAQAQYGDRNKAKDWACVRVAEDCLNSLNKGKE